MNMKNTKRSAAIKRARLLPFMLALALLPACSKAGDTRGVPAPATSPEPPLSAASPSVEPSAVDTYTPPEPGDYAGEIDVDDVMSKLSILAKYENSPLTSQNDPGQLDLLYFAIEYVLYGPNVTHLNYNKHIESGPELSVSSETLADCLFAVFGIAPDYLDRFKGGKYKFQSEEDYYDAETDMFYCCSSSADWLYGDAYIPSHSDTTLRIDGNRVDVSTVIVSPDGKVLSADYTLAAVTLGGELYYRLVSSDIYEDARNKNMLILSLDGTDFYAPWLTVIRDGEIEYRLWMSGGDYGGTSWTRPYPLLSQPPLQSIDVQYFRVNDNTGICRSVIYNGTAYLTFVYYGVCDTYVFDIETRAGYWMSGAEDLDAFYSVELGSIRELDALTEVEGGQLSYYLNFYVMTINREHGYVLIRRSDSADGALGGLRGKYFMRDLATGEETYICDSYAREHIISFMDELTEWKNDDHLRIGVAAEIEGGWMAVYDVIFDGQRWVASASDEPFWE